MKRSNSKYLKRLLASRANGAKSRGPVTAEGKRRSAANSLDHGLTAATVLLPGESEERFLDLLHGFEADFRPESTTARFLVEQLATSAWRMRRAQSYEVSLVHDQLAKIPSPASPQPQLSVSRAWADSRAPLAARYEAAHTRSFRHHLERLLALPLPGGDSPLSPSAPSPQPDTAENAPARNEPSSENLPPLQAAEEPLA